MENTYKRGGTCLLDSASVVLVQELQPLDFSTIGHLAFQGKPDVVTHDGFGGGFAILGDDFGFGQQVSAAHHRHGMAAAVCHDALRLPPIIVGPNTLLSD